MYTGTIKFLGFWWPYAGPLISLPLRPLIEQHFGCPEIAGLEALREPPLDLPANRVRASSLLPYPRHRRLRLRAARNSKLLAPGRRAQSTAWRKQSSASAERHDGHARSSVAPHSSQKSESVRLTAWHFGQRIAPRSVIVSSDHWLRTPPPVSSRLSLPAQPASIPGCGSSCCRNCSRGSTPSRGERHSEREFG
jgi:hypothetical protein